MVNKNPARLLEEFISTIQPDQYGESSLYGNFYQQTRAMRLLANTGQAILDSGIKYTYERIYPHWQEHISACASGNAKDISDADLTILRILADKLDETTDLTPSQKQWILDNKVEFSAEIIDLSNIIRADETLDEAFKKHIGALLDHVAECLNNVERGGLFNLGDSLFKLEVYIQSTLLRTDDDNVRAKIFEFLKKYVQPFAAETGRAIVHAGVQKMIEG